MIKLIFIYFIALNSLFSETIYKVPIKGTIDLGLPPFIKRVISIAEKDNASAIIFEINTFGGRVDAATQIKDAILGSKVPTIAFINRRAISAGALISLSCEKIYMTEGGLLGAATAVDMSGKKGSEKVISFMREEMASTAEKRGRNTEIARGMVDEELMFTHLVIKGDSIIVNDIEGRKEGKLISLTTEQALKYNISDGKAETLNELINLLGYSELVLKENIENWSEKLVRFLTNPVVASLLTTFGFLGILFELQSPGWGIPGVVGLICLILSLSASYIAQLATISDMLLIIAGLSLIMLEAFVIPGFGVVGISGIGIVVYGLYLLLIPNVPVGEEVLSNATDGFMIGLLGAIIGIYLLLKLMVKTKFWKQLTAPGSQKKEDGYTNSFGWESLIDQIGVADTDLHPSGWVRVEDKRFFMISEGDFIEKGSSVKILSVDGNRVLVKKL
ncbi:nodulation protein NfeD [Candidatus Marinimicrobia bacterium]|jgi:membrane-bound serine protease (ClpP class)|nr:nodulation protein NfeD [Candidatus Neomarinimicrobiota bacterium]